MGEERQSGPGTLSATVAGEVLEKSFRYAGAQFFLLCFQSGRTEADGWIWCSPGRRGTQAGREEQIHNTLSDVEGSGYEAERNHVSVQEIYSLI